ncbi:trehalose permease IIC protein [Alkalihalobacillus alcalophilus ATCC 27647 = CGMCC 1.3604]|uniref:protein-N(pi)-phosphohistidine--sucrose phosphotransferase n=1 Tax=Alkalihalobacillus alcalophilus ATCC 27647 = CGMCC 1.3604 TaxID=1218173 RepID=A0A094WNC9_ALKAL|nr:PTS system trehalose-specific EIIBC component [Alkalihalobacillus alcalophilus]KGA97483.1 trehalose permease IIC protein [Alkalihalobacillus alcalophilus ATCC 27647 = CGMCC 1.3604]MED1563274.1 PTS system trehalose-specific EIIBC component [Alkalihalobacillus alcalophilus]THG92230.1 trehalose permease IIC protein [Alkalihalobacillus alcalophilus ATCC 27647 = CGMCC 1.3604]
MSDPKKAAKEILAAIGGEENIDSATHCVTRLRFVLKDDDKVDKKALEKVDVVKGTFATDGQFQVIIGPKLVEMVYKELTNETQIEEVSKEEVKAKASKKMNPLKRAIKTLADIFIPILPAIVTAGLLLGINNILTATGIFGEQSLVEMYPQWADFANIINLIAGTAFAFLPALIGWSAVKRFGGNPLLGIVLGLILVHPDLLNAWAYGAALEAGEVPYWNLFGLEIAQMGYQGQVLPILVAAFILAKMEIFLKRNVPEGFQLLVVAPVALLVTGFLAFILIGPVTFTIGNFITDIFVWVFENVAAVGGLLYGLSYAPLVITGMHHTFLAIDVQLIGTIGGTFLWPILVLSNIAQGSAALAMNFLVKDEKIKGLSVTSSISAYLGITEPALFGVNLRYRFPFVFAITSAAIGGLWIAWNSVMAFSIGVGGLPGIFSIVTEQWGVFAIGMAIAFFLPLILTYFYGKTRKITD